MAPDREDDFLAFAMARMLTEENSGVNARNADQLVELWIEFSLRLVQRRAEALSGSD